MRKNLIQLQKRMILCIAAGIFCIIALGFSMSWMEQFQKEAAYREYQYNTGSYIAYFSGNLSPQDIDIIAEDDRVSQCGNLTYYKKILQGPGKDIWLRGANENYMLRNSTVLDGTFPNASNELIAEQWVLEAIGLEAKSGQTITFSLENEKGTHFIETFLVSGVLQNSAYSKENGLMTIFVTYNLEEQQYPIVHLDIKENEDLFESLQGIKGKLTSADAFFEYSSEAGAMRQQMNVLTDKQLGKSLFLAGIFLFYLICIYQLSEESFMQTFAKLRICGLSVRQILRIYFSLALNVCLILGLAGLAIGWLCVQSLVRLTRLDQIRFLFWGEQIAIKPNIFMPMFLWILVFCFLSVLLFFAWVCLKSAKGTILTQLKYGERAKRKSCHMKKFHKQRGKRLLYYQIEWISVVLLCLAQVVFLSVNYQQQANRRMAAHKTFSQCRNGDFQVLGYQSENIANGVTKEEIEAIENLSGTRLIETAAVLPIRVKPEAGISVAEDYYKKYNVYDCLILGKPIISAFSALAVFSPPRRCQWC